MKVTSNFSLVVDNKFEIPIFTFLWLQFWFQMHWKIFLEDFCASVDFHSSIFTLKSKLTCCSKVKKLGWCVNYTSTKFLTSSSWIQKHRVNQYMFLLTWCSRSMWRRNLQSSLTNNTWKDLAWFEGNYFQHQKIQNYVYTIDIIQENINLNGINFD